MEVYFTLSLKLMEEVEEAKCEGGAGASKSGWKPAGAEELATAGSRFHPSVVT